MVRFYIFQKSGYPTVRLGTRDYYCDELECLVPTRAVLDPEGVGVHFAMMGEGLVSLEVSRIKDSLEIMRCTIRE